MMNDIFLGSWAEAGPVDPGSPPPLIFRPFWGPKGEKKNLYGTRGLFLESPDN